MSLDLGLCHPNTPGTSKSTPHSHQQPGTLPQLGAPRATQPHQVQHQGQAQSHGHSYQPAAPSLQRPPLPARLLPAWTAQGPASSGPTAAELSRLLTPGMVRRQPQGHGTSWVPG